MRTCSLTPLFVQKAIKILLNSIIIYDGGSSVFGSLVVLDVVFRYLSLCLLYINTKISKNRCIMIG